MKRVATAAMAGICVVLAALRWWDSAHFTDMTTGFCTMGSYWLRYAMYAAALVLIVLCTLMQSANRQPLGRHRVGQGVLCGLTGVLFLAAGVAQGAEVLSGVVVPYLVALAVLLVLTAVWMFYLARSVTAKEPFAQAHSAAIGVAGTLSLLLLTVLRYAVRPSGLVRVSMTLEMLDAMFQMLFAVSLVRAAYLPGQNNGRRCFALGMIAFLGGTCQELPQAVFAKMSGASTWAEFLLSAALGGMGLVGLSCAWTVTAPQPTQKARVAPEIQQTP